MPLSRFNWAVWIFVWREKRENEKKEISQKSSSRKRLRSRLTMHSSARQPDSFELFLCALSASSGQLSHGFRFEMSILVLSDTSSRFANRLLRIPVLQSGVLTVIGAPQFDTSPWTARLSQSRLKFSRGTPADSIAIWNPASEPIASISLLHWHRNIGRTEFDLRMAAFSSPLLEIHCWEFTTADSRTSDCS